MKQILYGRNFKSSRLSRHIDELNRQKHDCILLQHDWQKNPLINFDFIILEIGPLWYNKILRLQKQRDYILLYKKQCYNRIGFSQNSDQVIRSTTQRQNSIPVIGGGLIVFEYQ